MIGSVSRFALLAALIAGPAMAQDPKPIAAVAAGGPAATGQEVTVVKVDREADDEAQGSLRWAIATSNAEPGRYRIEVSAPAIVLKSALPLIKGPVTIEGAAFARSGGHNVVDGSGYLPRDLKSCPGMVQGQYGTNVRTASNPGFALVDTKGVTLRGLQIRGFCIGVLVLRTSNAVIADNLITRNIGGAGVMLSGDDGKGGSTSHTTLDNKVVRNTFFENGDGLELTRGAAFNLIADNTFDGGTDNLEPSQGIEILWGNDNTVVRNRFLRYSDGLQLNWGARNYIAANSFNQNSFGISVSGADNMIEGNDLRGNGIGIAVRPEAKVAANRMSRNTFVGNGVPFTHCSAGGSCDPKMARGAIVVGPPGLEHAHFIGSRGMGVVFDKAGAAVACTGANDPANCHATPQFGLQPPSLASARLAGGKVAVKGEATGPASTVVFVELFAGKTAGERYLGTVKAVADAQGRAAFAGEVDTVGEGSMITATTTTAAGASSAFSKAVALGR
ncbi:nitrous oxide reductase family maturation protein NosD [Caulobacter sp. RHG1]|uniref:right-handed parallel beta-helix repeat-containing protein n=1 Tax=Caulobacter sp. (strain RHG1) TaxID=2545762 RepID=UPI00155163E7|nr:right-handed parallel beta-helix repeat-containing protein [Caulobacter sp. RHG1]NQE64860.1 3-dehydroshikimate dehydratase [Caulobacter sp. RHG1]